MSARAPARPGLTRAVVLFTAAIVSFASLHVTGRAWATDLPSDHMSGERAPPVWKSVRLGIHRGVVAYRHALDAAGIRVGDSADEAIGRPGVSYQRTEASIDLVRAAAAEIGSGEDLASLRALYARAARLGLAACPIDLALQLRLDYRNQPLGEVLHVAMKPLATYRGEPTILALANGGTGLLLVGSDGSDSFVVPPSFMFVFCRPVAVESVARRDDAIPDRQR